MTFKSFTRDMTHTFAPIVPVDGANVGTSVWQKAPLLSTNNPTALNYGHSFLFVKPGSALTTYTLKGMISVTCAFYTFNGNNGLGRTLTV